MKRSGGTLSNPRTAKSAKLEYPCCIIRLIREYVFPGLSLSHIRLLLRLLGDPQTKVTLEMLWLLSQTAPVLPDCQALINDPDGDVISMLVAMHSFESVASTAAFIQTKPLRRYREIRKCTQTFGRNGTPGDVIGHASQNGEWGVASLIITLTPPKKESLDYSLYKASGKGHDGIVKMLLEAKGSGYSGLAPSSCNGHYKTVKMLLNQGSPDLDGERETEVNYALYGACDKGHVRIVKMLLEAKPSHYQVSDVLIVASENGYPSIVKMLLEAKAEHRQPYHALKEARANGHDEVVQMLENDLLAKKRDSDT